MIVLTIYNFSDFFEIDNFEYFGNFDDDRNADDLNNGDDDYHDNNMQLLLSNNDG